MKRLLLFVVCLLAVGCKSREEILAAAEDKGKLLAEKNSRLVKGVGDGLQGEGKVAGESVVKGVTQVVRGGVTGAVEGATEIPISVGDGPKEAGIKAEKAAYYDEKDENGVSKNVGVKVYLILDKPFTGPVTLIAKDGKDREAGRAKAALEEKEPTGKFVTFTFDALVDVSTFAKLELR